MSTYVHYANSVATPLDISPEAQADPSVVLCSWKQTECPGSQGHCTSHHPPALKYTTSDSMINMAAMVSYMLQLCKSTGREARMMDF